MVTFFDYIFYRLFKFYQKRDGTPAIYASGVLSVVQFFILLSGLAAIRLFIDFPIPQKYFIIPIIVILIAINWKKYERNLDIEKFEEKWKAEDVVKRRRNGWLIVALIVISITFPIAIGVLKHNLGII
jgi:hypothetical protein